MSATARHLAGWFLGRSVCIFAVSPHGGTAVRITGRIVPGLACQCSPPGGSIAGAGAFSSLAAGPKRLMVPHPVWAPARWNGDLSLPAPRLGPFLLSCRQKEDAMVRDPWFVAAALFASASSAGLWWRSARQRVRFGSRQPGPWLPTLTFDWSQSATHTCGRNGDRAAREPGRPSTDATARENHLRRNARIGSARVENAYLVVCNQRC